MLSCQRAKAESSLTRDWRQGECESGAESHLITCSVHDTVERMELNDESTILT